MKDLKDYEGELLLQCVRRKTDTNDAPWKLTLRVDDWRTNVSTIVALASGSKAREIYEDIQRKWEESPDVGYKLTIKPYDCDRMVEGNSISVYLNKDDNFDIFGDTKNANT